MMWHEARRREKDIQKLFNEHKKRAEKRREENPTDPNSLLLVNGIKSKINLDSNIYKQAAKSLVIWQGDQATTIDRFDVRGTLSCLPKPDDEVRSRRHGSQRPTKSSVLDADEADTMKKLLNFERYRLLIQADLNKVSEEKRLNLVGRSEYLSEAKMKKLENNWFGTSGETSISNQHHTSSHRLNTTHQQSRSQGVAIGYNYSQGLPMLPQSNKDEPSSQDSDKSIRHPVIDLDFYGTSNLDSVEKSRYDSSQTSEITRRYGLSCDEFNLLTEADRDGKSTKEILDILQDLRNERKKNFKVSILSVQPPESQELYGPDLPPRMFLGISRKRGEDSKDACASANSTPVQQRSPSADDMILRSADTIESPSPPSPPPLSPAIQARSPPPINRRAIARITINLGGVGKNEELKPVEQEESSQVKIVEPNCDHQLTVKGKNSISDTLKSDISKTVTSTMIPINLFAKQSNIQPENNTSDKLITADTGTEKKVDLDSNQTSENIANAERRTRRAETPLAYKRYQRSSRSLSRDRRSSSRHNSSSRYRNERSASSRHRSRSSSRSFSSSYSNSCSSFATGSRSNSVSCSTYSSSGSCSCVSFCPRRRKSRSRSPIRRRSRGMRGRRRAGRGRWRARRSSKSSPEVRESRRSPSRDKRKTSPSKSQSNRKHGRSRSRSRSRPRPKHEPKPKLKPRFKPKSKPRSEPKTELKPERKPKPELKPKSKPKPEPDPKPRSRSKGSAVKSPVSRSVENRKKI